MLKSESDLLSLCRCRCIDKFRLSKQYIDVKYRRQKVIMILKTVDRKQTKRGGGHGLANDDPAPKYPNLLNHDPVKPILNFT